MTREYNHDDICRGASDGCDCEWSCCMECGVMVHDSETVDGICRECRCTWACVDCGDTYEPGYFDGPVCDGCHDRRRESDRIDAALTAEGA